MSSSLTGKFFSMNPATAFFQASTRGPDFMEGEAVLLEALLGDVGVLVGILLVEVDDGHLGRATPGR